MLLLVTFSCLLLRPCSSSAAEGGNVTASQRALSVFSVVKVRRARGSVLRAHVRIVSSSPTLPAPPPRPGEMGPATPARSAPPRAAALMATVPRASESAVSRTVDTDPPFNCQFYFLVIFRCYLHHHLWQLPLHQHHLHQEPQLPQLLHPHQHWNMSVHHQQSLR